MLLGWVRHSHECKAYLNYLLWWMAKCIIEIIRLEGIAFIFTSASICLEFPGSVISQTKISRILKPLVHSSTIADMLVILI